MKILLIDADSTIPNLALMQLSAWRKQQGDSVVLLKANLPYYPNRKKKNFFAPSGFDRTYCSVVFDGNAQYIKGDNIIFGGTGFDLTTVLPKEASSCEPDYSIYPDNDTSYGFISRGCIRKCYFCVVPKKEGWIRQVSNVDDIVKHKKVKFLDNNFLALPNHKKILTELIDKNIRCQFNQGLDIRLVDNENSHLLSRLNYLGEYIFAFDDYSYLPIIKKKLDLMDWRKPFNFKFFVYCHPDMDVSNICKRIEWLKHKKILPYLMRHISCWDSSLNKFYIDLAAYSNQPNCFKKMSFRQFLEKRHINKNRILDSKNLYYKNI